jgi:amino acid transporter
MSDSKTPLLQPLLGNDTADTNITIGTSHSKNALGTINGCYVPCLLNIMGIVLFLRLSWATGQAGVVPTLGMLFIATFQTLITVLSLSALVTNGVMSTGGSYYMIR